MDSSSTPIKVVSSVVMSLLSGEKTIAWAPAWAEGVTAGITRLPNLFLSSIKSELIKKQIYPTRAQVKSEIFEYIEEFYDWRKSPREKSGKASQVTILIKFNEVWASSSCVMKIV